MEHDTVRTSEVQIDPVKLKQFFVQNLDRIYCAKTHIVDSFPGIAKQAHFSDLYHAIMETVEDIRKQILRMEEIYVLLSVKSNKSSCTGLTSMLQEAVAGINEADGDVELRDMAILFYLQNIESVEVASFQILRILAKKFNNGQIDQLLRENFDEAKEDRSLLMMITQKYVD